MSMERRSSWRIEGEATEAQGEGVVAERVVWMLRQHRFVMHVEPGWLSSGNGGQTLAGRETFGCVGEVGEFGAFGAVRRWW